MSILNQTELSAYIQALAATHDETAFKALLDDTLNQSLKQKKDTINNVTDSGTVALNYLGYQHINLDMTGGSATVSFSNIQIGQKVRLSVTKNSGNSLLFSGATDISRTISYTTQTSLVFEVMNINSVIYVNRIQTFPTLYQSVYQSLDITSVTDSSGVAVSAYTNSLFEIAYNSGGMINGSLFVTLGGSTSYIRIYFNSDYNYGGSVLRGHGIMTTIGSNLPVEMISTYYGGSFMQVYNDSGLFSASSHIISFSHASQI